MKITCISDTHGLHEALTVPAGDMIIHAGDVSNRGRKEEVVAFLDWYSNLDFKYKIFIAGNHDFFFEKASQEEVMEINPSNVIYLNDSGIDINGIKIWGSPIQPWFYDWAFNRQRGSDIQKHWALIPKETDILITHGPAQGILDQTIRKEYVGCADLFRTIQDIKPQYHIAGHIHEAYGRERIGDTEFINASVLDVKYRMANPPITIEL